jgi:hypothetical protein
MPDRTKRSKSIARVIRNVSLALIAASFVSACGNSSGPAVARTLTLYAVDGNFMPAAVKSADGRTITIGVGRLQGTDLGPTCGMSLQLNTGPITSAEVPSCKLISGEEFKFTATLSDPRFPTGAHQYRFVPP